MAQYDYWPRYGLENYSVILPLEETFNPVNSTQWMQRNWHHSITGSIIYVVLIFLGKKLMENRKPFDFTNALFAWNSLLAVFSILGFVRMTPEWIWSWAGEGNSFKYSVCTASFAQGVTGFWTEQFAMSKIAEFVDTAFIVLRKRPLIFLHWYHHVTVTIYTWHAYKDHTASGRWFIWMNYGVHSVMYSYYALRSKKIRLPKQLAMVITILQIAQMVMGVLIGITVYRVKAAGGACQQSFENLWLCFAIYFSYFLLFCNFFYHAYLKKNNRYVELNKKKVDDKPEDEINKKCDINANISTEDINNSTPSMSTRGAAARRRAQKAD
ncbi:unnamed protein product [Caenorhabditis bovis]|uniref:Very-long-chain 3-oxoacyl-CoA synthase n=1 Tax=Caenorhabditis bovis TaxID=2654633 RepID=A0A8S1F529_9PELO|nr:unnamed protein product [Caenorhabditis bovis]